MQNQTSYNSDFYLVFFFYFKSFAEAREKHVGYIETLAELSGRQSGRALFYTSIGLVTSSVKKKKILFFDLNFAELMMPSPGEAGEPRPSIFVAHNSISNLSGVDLEGRSVNKKKVACSYLRCAGRLTLNPGVIGEPRPSIFFPAYFDLRCVVC